MLDYLTPAEQAVYLETNRLIDSCLTITPNKPTTTTLLAAPTKEQQQIIRTYAAARRLVFIEQKEKLDADLAVILAKQSAEPKRSICL